MNHIDLKDRVAVVTGGAQGIGYAISERLLRSGAAVALWDIDAGRIERELDLGLAGELSKYDAFGTAEERREASLRLLELLRARAAARCAPPRPGQLIDEHFAVDLERIVQLLDLQSDHVISIGE